MNGNFCLELNFSRLQHSLQNSCDIPKPVVGITSGVYSNESMSSEETLDRVLKAIQNKQERLSLFNMYDNVQDGNWMLHYTLEAFQNSLDGKKLVKKCLRSENPQAASKVSLLCGNILQAFEFTLQAYIKAGLVGNDIFQAFIYFLHYPCKSEDNDQADVKRQLVERLIACWQDQKYSFLQLENLFIQVNV